VSYLNITEVDTAIQNLAGAYPTLTQLITLPHTSIEGRTIHALRIGAGDAGSREVLMMIGGQHAREWGSCEICINFAADLLEAYQTNQGLSYGGKRFTADQLKSIVDDLHVVVCPLVNPDGRNYSQTTPMGAGWRRNRNPAYSGGNSFCIGVDLNRNYEFLFDFKNKFHPTAYAPNNVDRLSVSDDPCDPAQTFHGPSAFSEPETQNVKWLLDMFLRTRWFFDIHSYSRLVLYNWGDDENQTAERPKNFHNASFDAARGLIGDNAYKEYLPFRDKFVAQRLAERVRDAIGAVRGEPYIAQPSVALYPTCGTSMDYSYSRHFLDPAKDKIYSFTIEWGNEFQPDWSEMELIVADITAGLLEACIEGPRIELTDLLFYKRSVGEGLFVSTDGSGKTSTIKQYTDWDRDWDLIIPGNFGGGGHTDLLFYKRSIGEGLFVSTYRSGETSTIKRYTNWDRDWDLIIPGNFGGGGHTDLLFYKRSVGEGLFVNTYGSGETSTINQYTNWDRDWDMIIPGNFGGGGHTGLLFYKRSVGEGLFVSTYGSAETSTIKQYVDWDRDWNLIISSNFGGGGHTDLLFYKRSVGEGLFVSIYGSAETSTIKQYTDWDRDWDLIIPGNFGGGGHSDLLFYKRSAGEGLFVSTYGSSETVIIKQYTNWDRDWYRIIPGSFGDVPAIVELGA
jgi:murein tripeptide amidase MpaA